MRIGINARVLIQNKLEGIGWHAYEMISRLIQLRSEDTFYLFYDRKNEILIPEGKNVFVIIISPPTRHPLLLHIWSDYILPNALVKNKIDLFYSPEPILPKKINIPSIITVHDISPITFSTGMSKADVLYYQKILVRNTSLATKVITVSNFSKSEIIKYNLCSSDKVEMVYNGIRSVFVPVSETVKQSTKNRYTGGKPYFISIGSINERKNITRIIQVFNEYKSTTKNDHFLIFVGKKMGATREIDLAYESSPYKMDILFMGYQSEEITAALLASADLLINLSSYEGFGMQLVEAMQSGVPVFASNLSCYPEIVQDAGMLVSPGDIKNMVISLNQLIIDREKYIQKGIKRALVFDWDISAHQLNKLINQSTTKTK